MARCPSCNAPINPLRLVTYTRWTPYRCLRCGERSRFASSEAVLVVVVVFGLVGTIWRQIFPVHGALALALHLVGLYLLTLFFYWSWVSLEPVDDSTAPPSASTPPSCRASLRKDSNR